MLETMSQLCLFSAWCWRWTGFVAKLSAGRQAHMHAHTHTHSTELTLDSPENCPGVGSQALSNAISPSSSHQRIYVWEPARSQYVPGRLSLVVLVQCWKRGRRTRDILFRKHLRVKRRKERHRKPLPPDKCQAVHEA